MSTEKPIEELNPEIVEKNGSLLFECFWLTLSMKVLMEKQASKTLLLNDILEAGNC